MSPDQITIVFTNGTTKVYDIGTAPTTSSDGERLLFVSSGVNYVFRLANIAGWGITSGTAPVE